jgi:hypothetical protein
MVLLITGCATPQLGPISTYNPVMDARIRVYQNHERRIYLFPNQTAEQILFIRSVFGQAINLKTAYKQLATRKISNFLPYDGFAETHNFIVRGGQPLTILGYIVDTDSGYPDYVAYGDGCNAVFATFVPEAGYSYITYIEKIGGKYESGCYLHVLELKSKFGEVKEVPVSNITRIELRKLAK